MRYFIYEVTRPNKKVIVGVCLCLKEEFELLKIDLSTFRCFVITDRSWFASDLADFMRTNKRLTLEQLHTAALIHFGVGRVSDQLTTDDIRDQWSEKAIDPHDLMAAIEL
jgi:hypothetical protein